MWHGSCLSIFSETARQLINRLATKAANPAPNALRTILEWGTCLYRQVHLGQSKGERTTGMYHIASMYHAWSVERGAKHASMPTAGFQRTQARTAGAKRADAKHADETRIQIDKTGWQEANERSRVGTDLSGGGSCRRIRSAADTDRARPPCSSLGRSAGVSWLGRFSRP